MNKYREWFIVHNETSRSYANIKWNFESAKYLSMENFYIWSKVDELESNGDPISEDDLRKDFNKELWSKLGKFMWRKNQYDFQDYVEYIYKDIVKPFRVSILQYAERICEMQNISK